MGMVEHVRQLHAQAGEIVDVEEAPVVDVVGGDAENRRRASTARGSAHRARASRRSTPLPAASSACARRLVCRAQRGELGLQRARRSATCGRQCGRSEKESPSRSSSGCWSPRMRRSAAGRSAACARRRPRRRSVPSASKFQLELAGSQLLAILGAEQRHQQLVLSSARSGSQSMSNQPAYCGIRAPFQDVEPQRIVGAADAHVVGHEIENLPEPFARNASTMREKSVSRPEFRIELVMIDDVIAVHAAGPRLEDRARHRRG